ncbi:MAG: macro domain-containing protein [Clostridia bacterium]
MRWLVKLQDITREAVDAVVNAANSRLLGGGGVDGAIHRAAGPGLVRALQQYPGCPAGQAVVTPGFALPARHIIHTVGPVWRGGGGGEAAVLRQAYLSALRRAVELGARTVAFPAISTGVYGYPLREALTVAAEALAAGAKLQGAPEAVRLIAYTRVVEETWLSVLGTATGEWPAF